MPKLEPTGGAKLRVNDDGEPYWSLWGADWKDGTDMDPGHPVTLSPAAFPPGTRITIHEPGPDTEASRKFYAKCHGIKKE